MEHLRYPPALSIDHVTDLRCFSAFYLSTRPIFWGFFWGDFVDLALEELVGQFGLCLEFLEGQDNRRTGTGHYGGFVFLAVLCNDLGHWEQSKCHYKGWLGDECASSLQFQKQNTTDALCPGYHEP